MTIEPNHYRTIRSCTGDMIEIKIDRDQAQYERIENACREALGEDEDLGYPTGLDESGYYYE